MSTLLKLFGVNDKLPKVARESNLLIVGDLGLLEADDAVLKPILPDLFNVSLIITIEVKSFDVRSYVTIVLNGSKPFFHKHLPTPVEPL